MLNNIKKVSEKNIKELISQHSQTQVRVVEECSSTSTILLDDRLRCEYFPPNIFPVALITKHQNAGRGQNNRFWFDDKNAILFSLAGKTPANINIPPWATLALGVTMAQTLTDYGFNGIRLKWSNDLYWQAGDIYKKLGGILFERKKNLWVLGVGINVGKIPDEIIYQQKKLPNLFPITPVSLSEIPCSQEKIDISQIIASLIINIEKSIAEISKAGKSFADYLHIWQKFDALVSNDKTHQLINIHQHNNVYRGVYAGLNKDGAIMINVEGKVHEVVSGRVEIC